MRVEGDALATVRTVEDGITYEATRLTFLAKIIEPLKAGESFTVICRDGNFRMTKEQFYARWRIERMFRDLKQNLSFGKLLCPGEKGADVAVCIPFVLLVSLRLDPPEDWQLKEVRVIGLALRQLREGAWDRSVGYLISTREKSKLTKMRARRQRERLCQKPVDRLAEVA